MQTSVYLFFLLPPSLQGSSEVLQCPRCQASVPPHPGVCGTCGENVYQCHKCRAINYDEKDPFLCNSCGFSKYAKFDTFLEARSCSAVDPIESEDDRAKVCWQKMATVKIFGWCVKNINTAWAKIVYLIAQSAVNLRISVLRLITSPITCYTTKLII